jgi:starvation-inducible DNA-binding protein
MYRAWLSVDGVHNGVLQMMPIGLSHDQHSGVIDILNPLFADEFVLYIKTRHDHWHVVGPQFNDLHTLFEAQYRALGEIVDEVAERARALGGNALGTWAECMSQTRLKAHPGRYPAAGDMIADLLADHVAVIRQVRVAREMSADVYADMGTHDFLIGLMTRHENMAWM